MYIDWLTSFGGHEGRFESELLDSLNNQLSKAVLGSTTGAPGRVWTSGSRSISAGLMLIWSGVDRSLALNSPAHLAGAWK